jgi:hypothetical protein
VAQRFFCCFFGEAVKIFQYRSLSPVTNITFSMLWAELAVAYKFLSLLILTLLELYGVSKNISSPVTFFVSVRMIIPGRPCLYLICHLQWYSSPPCVWLYPAGRVYMSSPVIFFASVCDYTRQAVSMSLCFVINDQFWEAAAVLYKSFF